MLSTEGVVRAEMGDELERQLQKLRSHGDRASCPRGCRPASERWTFCDDLYHETVNVLEPGRSRALRDLTAWIERQLGG